MDKVQLEKILREYKTNKATVDVTLARIEQWEYAKCNPDTWYKGYVSVGRELGMPGSPLRNISSPVESQVCLKELTVEEIEQWIEDEKSKIYMLKAEVRQIEMALKGITAQEQFVIELKYFDNMFWKDIELSFRATYNQGVTDIRLKQIIKVALYKLCKIL